MRIWIVNHHADPPDGLATRSYDIARRLVQRGHEVTIVVSNFSHYHKAPMRQLGRRLWHAEMLDGVRMIWIGTPPYRGNDARRVANMAVFSGLACAYGLVDRQSPDVVIGVSVHPLAALTGWVLAMAHRARFFFEVTDLWPQTLIDFGTIESDSLMARGMRRLERFLFRRAERIIMLWRDTGDYVESTGVDRDKVVWIPHGVELDRYAQLKPYDGGRRRQFRIMFLGGFVNANALDVILAAAGILQQRGRTDIRFLLVGAGTERQQILNSADHAGLRNVEFPPPVPKARVPEMMQQADAFIYGLRDLPLYRYGISLNKLTDYLAGGRPIIFFGNSSYDPVRLANAGFSVPPAHPEAVADATEKLAGLAPRERIAMGRRGRRYLEEHHTVAHLTDRLEEILTAGQSRGGHQKPLHASRDVPSVDEQS